MSNVWNILDSELTSIYSNYLRVQNVGSKGMVRVHPVVAGGSRLNVSLQYTGNLAEIEALGFQTTWQGTSGQATGAIDLADLEQLAEHPGVVKMSFGQEPEPFLDISIPDIRANQVWTFSGGTFSGSSGTGVIVGIIDTGIEFRHPFFLKKTGPPKETRILRIWDQGLEKVAGEHNPNLAHLSSGATGSYGVEYDNTMINAVLNGVSGATSVRHRDCKGHGTHVASIAAGNGRGVSGTKFIGVAPEADLIIVKYLDLEKYPKVGGVSVNNQQRFQDAVSYVLNVAKNVFVKPVVINCSFGRSMGPHDGFTDEEDWLTYKFSGSTGEILVQAAGNDAGHRKHVRVEFPTSGGTVEIPFKLYDRRGAKKLEFSGCQWFWGTRDLDIELYYPPGGSIISAGIDIPGDGAGFISGPSVGSTPPPPVKFGGRQCRMRHVVDNQTLTWTGRGTVNRNLFEFKIEPYRNRHRLGRYTVRISSTGQKTVHVWCSQVGYARGHGFEVDTTPPLPANVHLEENKSLIGSNGGADNIITVAAYNAEVPSLDITSFSSRGPLVSYGGSPVQPTKPDIAAPGQSIDAAKSVHAKPWLPVRIVAKSGTSMAAPHVTGVVALMLQKNPTRNAAQILATLKAEARTLPPTTADEAGSGRIDAKESFDQTP